MATSKLFIIPIFMALFFSGIHKSSAARHLQQAPAFSGNPEPFPSTTTPTLPQFPPLLSTPLLPNFPALPDFPPLGTFPVTPSVPFPGFFTPPSTTTP
ncbi:hypothetical protein LguiA_027231 [Lonicera macranthoides]